MVVSAPATGVFTCGVLTPYSAPGLQGVLTPSSLPLSPPRSPHQPLPPASGPLGPEPLPRAMPPATLLCVRTRFYPTSRAGFRSLYSRVPKPVSGERCRPFCLGALTRIYVFLFRDFDVVKVNPDAEHRSLERARQCVAFLLPGANVSRNLEHFLALFLRTIICILHSGTATVGDYC